MDNKLRNMVYEFVIYSRRSTRIVKFTNEVE